MSNQYFTFDRDTIQHLTKKIVDVVPSSTSELTNDENYATKDFLNREIENKGFDPRDRVFIDDSKITEQDLWSSNKIEDFILENNGISWIDVKEINPTVENTKEGHMKEVEIFGNTWQDSDGKNLLIDVKLHESVKNISENEYQFSPYSANKCEFKGKEKTQYTFSGFAKKDEPGYTNLIVYYDNGEAKGYSCSDVEVGKYKEFKYTSQSGKTITHFTFYGNSNTSTIKELQIEEGLEATEYEKPHKADLSDIRHVGERQDDGRYKIEVESCGKNLIYKKDYSGGYYLFTNGGLSINNLFNSFIAKVKPNTKYITTNVHSNITFWTDEMKFISGIGSHFNKFFTTPKNTTYIRMAVENKHDNTCQLEEGSEATPYEPYKSSKHTLLLPCPLSKIGDVQDRLYWNGEKYVIEKNIEIPKDTNELLTEKFVLKEPKLIETDITEQIFPPTYKDKTYFFVKGGLDGKIKGKVPVDTVQSISSLTKKKNDLLKQKQDIELSNNSQNELLDLVNLASQETLSIVEMATLRDTLD